MQLKSQQKQKDLLLIGKDLAFWSSLIATVLTCILLDSHNNFGQAQVLLNQERGQFSLKNQSAADLLDVQRGTRMIGRLASGETWHDDEIPARDLLDKERPLTVDGQIKLEHWGDALNQLPGNTIWARLQLQTAGMDVNRGLSMTSLLGAKQLNKNIARLKQSSAEMGKVWLASGPLTPLKAALLAYAARYAPVNVLLSRLLPNLSPYQAQDKLGNKLKIESPTWPEGYESLPDPRTSLRNAIELHGVSALPIILESKVWSKDRGFSDIQLAFALLPEITVIQALKKRGNTELAQTIEEQFRKDRELAMEKGSLAAESYLRKMFEARAKSDQATAISQATRAALFWRRYKLIPEASQVAKVVCSYIDMGAQRAINEKLLLAARAYLNLGQFVCFGHPFYRARAAEFTRTRGDLSFFDFDLESSVHWYRAAVQMSEEIIDKVRLIDTLARLAIIKLIEEDYRLANDYLKEARSQETPQVPPRKMLMIAEDLMPTPDNRARVGMIFLIVVLGIGAFSQILKVIFGGKKK